MVLKQIFNIFITYKMSIYNSKKKRFESIGLENKLEFLPSCSFLIFCARFQFNLSTKVVLKNILSTIRVRCV